MCNNFPLYLYILVWRVVVSTQLDYIILIDCWTKYWIVESFGGLHILRFNTHEFVILCKKKKIQKINDFGYMYLYLCAFHVFLTLLLMLFPILFFLKIFLIKFHPNKLTNLLNDCTFAYLVVLLIKIINSSMDLCRKDPKKLYDLIFKSYLLYFLWEFFSYTLPCLHYNVYFY